MPLIFGYFKDLFKNELATFLASMTLAIFNENCQPHYKSIDT